MIQRLSYSLFFLIILSYSLFAQSTTGNLPLPSRPQLRWQQYEQIMFTSLDPCTWQGREKDDHSLPLTRINPAKLNTDQWCMAAKVWGAKLILFVAKHTGGFCWWQTETSKYSVSHIPWKNGQGDVLRDLSNSCRKYGLGLGIYVYPGDEQWGAGIGSGGKTNDPTRQNEYNKVYRQQLTEVLTQYGSIKEVWFDGSCVIDVSDILMKYASDAVIFQGSLATIRWVGNENGIVPYPNWYTLKSSDLMAGDATALQSNPDGDVYAPVEADVPLLKNKGHKWFWAPNTDHMILNPTQLIDVYYSSVGRGAVMLLNSTPDTTGLIPKSHMKVYKSFGNEIKRRFNKPIKSISGIGNEVTIEFKKPVPVNHVIIQEELLKGQRVRQYVLEGFENNCWSEILSGYSIGNKRIEPFNTRVVSKLRLQIKKSAAEPQIKKFAAYNVKGFNLTNNSTTLTEPRIIDSWTGNTFNSNWQTYTFDLTPYLTSIGQYELNFQVISSDIKGNDGDLEFKDWKVEMYGNDLPEVVKKIKGRWAFLITHSQQTDKDDKFQSVFKVMVRTKHGETIGNIQLKMIDFK